MAYNGNGYVALDEGTNQHKTKRESMEYFDSLPADVRAVLRDAHYNVTIRKGHEHKFKNSRMLRDTLLYVAKDSARKTYGDSYPLETVR